MSNGDMFTKNGEGNLRIRNDGDGHLTRAFKDQYGRSPESDPQATGYLHNGEPTYSQVGDQTAEEVSKELSDLDGDDN